MTATTTRRQHKALRAISTIALACALTALHTSVQAQPVSSSSLYYRIGGGSPAGGASNRGALSLQLGAGAHYNYSCGKFDIGASWSDLMNSIQNLGGAITGAVQAGIAALPLYFLQRAQPGLYQLFTNFSHKADLLVAASLKTCEEMEAMIRADKNPYEDYIALAKGDLWKIKASQSGNIVQAKTDLNKNEEAQNSGVRWIGGGRAGGAGTAPIQPVRDLAIAGYNITINKEAKALATENYGSSTLASTRLVQAFKTPEELARWSTEVLGDQKIYLCSQGPDCPTSTSTVTATGLAPKFEKELGTVLPAMRSLATASTVQQADLAAASAPGMSISPQLVDAMRKMPADMRAVAVNRLSQEIAMHKVIDKALIARNALISGLTLPEATAAKPVQTEVQTKIERLTQYVNDMMFEFRIRKEMTGDTALAIMGSRTQVDMEASGVNDATRRESMPLENGRVRASQ